MGARFIPVDSSHGTYGLLCGVQWRVLSRLMWGQHFRSRCCRLVPKGRLTRTALDELGERESDCASLSKASGPKGGPELHGRGWAVRSDDEGAALKGRGAWGSAVIRLPSLRRGFLLLALPSVQARRGRVILVAWSIGGPRAILRQR